ncbi:3027_t:CDS:2, partial [Paraglomus occultum]
QPQLEDDYWNLNITSKQFVGKDASGFKWFECDILCSHHKNVSRLAGRSLSAKRGSKLMITGELEINESQIYCEKMMIMDKNDSPSRRYRKSKQVKSAEKRSEEPTTRQFATPPSHIEPTSPPSPATLTSDNSAAETTSPSKEKKKPSRRQP